MSENHIPFAFVPAASALFGFDAEMIYSTISAAAKTSPNMFDQKLCGITNMKTHTNEMKYMAFA